MLGQADTCPKCGKPRFEGSADCPYCGIVYERYGPGGQPPSQDGPSDPAAPATIAPTGQLPAPQPNDVYQGPPIEEVRAAQLNTLEERDETEDDTFDSPWKNLGFSLFFFGVTWWLNGVFVELETGVRESVRIHFKENLGVLICIRN